MWWAAARGANQNSGRRARSRAILPTWVRARPPAASRSQARSPGGGDEGVDDVERDDEIFVEALEVAYDLGVVDGIAELVGILAEAIAGAPAGGGKDRGGEAGASFFEKAYAHPRRW